MLNNFCFQVYAQKWVLVIMSHVTCHILHVTCHMSNCACHMSYIKCLCWFLGHAEQLLFWTCWSLCSKVSICNYVTCHMLHVTCRMSHVTCLMSNAYVDPWDMLNNFCFHVYAQMSLFMPHFKRNAQNVLGHLPIWQQVAARGQLSQLPANITKTAHPCGKPSLWGTVSVLFSGCWDVHPKEMSRHLLSFGWEVGLPGITQVFHTFTNKSFAFY